MMIQIYEVMLPWKRWVNSISSQKVLFLDSLFLFWTALIVIYVTNSFVADDECVSIQLEATLANVRECVRCAHKVLMIHGDGCYVPNQVRFLMPSVEVHDWLLYTDEAKRIKKLKEWLALSRRCHGDCVSKTNITIMPLLLLGDV